MGLEESIEFADNPTKLDVFLSCFGYTLSQLQSLKVGSQFTVSFYNLNGHSHTGQIEILENNILEIKFRDNEKLLGNLDIKEEATFDIASEDLISGTLEFAPKNLLTYYLSSQTNANTSLQELFGRPIRENNSGNWINPKERGGAKFWENLRTLRNQTFTQK